MGIARRAVRSRDAESGDTLVYAMRFAATSRWLWGLAVALVAGSAAVAAGPGMPEPATGRFLIATRQLTAPTFARSVVLLVAYGTQGAVGLIINRPTQLALGSLVPDEESLRERPDRVHVGGPVAHGAVMLLIRAEAPPANAERVLGDVWVSRSATALRQAVAAGLDARRLRAYVGYAGWAAGQLDAEIARGDWHVAPGEADLVFSDSPDEVWPQLEFEYGGRQVRARPALRSARRGRVY